MIFEEQPTDPWTKFDFLLIEAYQILKDETCGDCGNPVWICHNHFAANVGFKIKNSTCFAKAELERHHELQEKAGSKKKTYGQTEYPVPYTYDNSDMPTRLSYYMELAKEYSAMNDV